VTHPAPVKSRLGLRRFHHLLLGLSAAEEPGALLLPQAVALPVDVQDMAVMQQPVQDGGGDDHIPQHLAPFGETLVGCQDDAPPLVAGRDEGEKCCGRLAVVGPDAELVNDEHLGRQVDAYAAVQPMLGLGASQVLPSRRSWARTK